MHLQLAILSLLYIVSSMDSITAIAAPQQNIYHHWYILYKMF